MFNSNHSPLNFWLVLLVMGSLAVGLVLGRTSTNRPLMDPVPLTHAGQNALNEQTRHQQAMNQVDEAAYAERVERQLEAERQIAALEQQRRQREFEREQQLQDAQVQEDIRHYQEMNRLQEERYAKITDLLSLTARLLLAVCAVAVIAWALSLVRRVSQTKPKEVYRERQLLKEMARLREQNQRLLHLLQQQGLEELREQRRQVPVVPQDGNLPVTIPIKDDTDRLAI